MTYFPGGSLASYIKAWGPLPLHSALCVVSSIGKVLQPIHALGFIHRDLKPDNILFDAEYRVHIGDWGLAKHITEGPQLTGEGCSVGTIGYFDPNWSSALNLSPARDVYALAKIFFHLVGLENTHQITEQNLRNIIDKALKGQFKTIASFLDPLHFCLPAPPPAPAKAPQPVEGLDGTLALVLGGVAMLGLIGLAAWATSPRKVKAEDEKQQCQKTTLAHGSW